MNYLKLDGYKVINGVYFIQNKINNKIYIGSSCDIYNRWYQHTTELNENRHCNSHLQNSWNKYGEQNFFFGILDIVAINKEDCYQYVIDRVSIERKRVAEFESLNDKKGYNLVMPVNNTYMITEKDLKEGKASISYENFQCIVDLLVNTDISISEISRITGVKPEKIYSIYYKKTYCLITKDLFFQSRSLDKNYIKMEQVLKEEIFDMIEKGMGYKSIANIFNLSPKAVKKFCEEHGRFSNRAEKKQIYCFDLTGRLLKIYNSRKEAAEDLQILDSLISNNIAGRLIYVKRKYWFSNKNKFKELTLEEQLAGNILSKDINPMVCYDTKNDFITIYPTPKYTDLPYKSWAMYCHKIKEDKKGRRWKYLKELPEEELKRLLELKEQNKIKVININGESNI